MLLLAAVLCIPVADAAEATIKMRSNAPAGQRMRIYSTPYNSITVTGADADEFAFTYLSKGPGELITLTGEIEQLEVFGCELTELEVVSAPELAILKCYNNKLTTLDVTKAPKLAVLNCNENKLTSLDVSANPLLENLDASKNALESVALATLPALQKLNLAGNRLVSVDVAGCTKLEDLYVQNNLLTSLDLSANSKMWWVYVFGNQLAGEGMDKFTSTLPHAAQTPGMMYIVDTRDEAEGNVCLMKNVEALSERGWVSCDYAGGVDNGAMVGTFYYGADYVPTVSSRTITLTTGKAVGEKVTFTISATDDIEIEGVEENAPYTGTNQFTLTSTTVVIKGDVSSFDCPGNDITSLVLTGNPVLTWLDCSQNSIEELAVVNAARLTRLNCNDNKLKSLNIEGCTGIMRVDCFNNCLKGNAMRSFMRSLPDGTANNPYLFVIDTTSATEENVATTDDVAIATGKKWDVFDWNGGANFGFGVKYEGSEPTAPVLPDEYFVMTAECGSHIMFTAEFTDCDAENPPVVEGCELSGWNGNTLTLNITVGQPFKVYGNATNIEAPFCVVTAMDITNLPALENLNLCLNELTELDLSASAALQTLSVEGNHLTTLDLSTCPSLIYVNCYGNDIVGDGMTSMMESLPDYSGKTPGQIIVFDENFSAESNICLMADIEIAKGRNWEVYALDENMNPFLYEGADMSGVENVTVDATADTADVYDLSGRLVRAKGEGLQGLRPGIYLRGTSKIYVK